MRKLNLKTTAIICFVVISATSKVSALESKLSVNSPSSGQEQIIRLLEEDFNFEAQRKQLSNQLALEKLKNELNKLRSDNQPVHKLPSSSPKDDEVVGSSSISMEPPAIVLISEVAGIVRILVNDGGTTKLRKPNDYFTANNGKKYKLAFKGKMGYSLQEVS
ncbi:Uncharacterised protein [Edwardsiella tarda]|nr:Uncharacterised protein [Edwardsiella tarda]